MAAHTPKLILFGIDGAGYDLVSDFVAAGKLPNLAALMATGQSGPLRSTLPPVTFPAWSSILTGANPSYHGLTDFTVRQGYSVRFVGGRERNLPTIFGYLESLGLTTGAAWFPTTYPPEPLKGYQIAGWDSPVTSVGDAGFVHPRSLHAELFGRFGQDHLLFDVVDEFADGDDWYANARKALVSRVEKKTAVAKWLLKRRPTDFAAFYFGETDTVSHHFWALHDPNSPRRPREIAADLESSILDVYQAVDQAIGEILTHAGNNCSVMVVSDHGSGGSSNIAVHLNRVLGEAGLLKFNSPSSRLRMNSNVIRGQLPRLIPQKLRRRLFRMGGGLAPSIAESTLRFGGIDFSRTAAFSEELNYAPSIWFNQLGREPKGILKSTHRHRAFDAVTRACEQLSAPDGRPLVKNVTLRETLYTGPYSHQIPDVILEMEPLDGYTPCALPSEGRPGSPVRLLRSSEYLGRKGRSLPGCHTPNGIFVATIPGKQITPFTRQPGVEHMARLACESLGVQPAKWHSSFDSQEAPSVAASVATRGFDINDQQQYNPRDEELIARRLKQLGYL